MDFKTKVGPPAIAAAVVALLVVVFLIYHFTLGSAPGNKPVSADNRPDYVKQLEKGGRPSWAPMAPPSSNKPTTP